MRRGSALLIVLGMLAFMVTSAVGFAIYMREGRVPSSHLRRESTARYLLKSALANAIAGLDGTDSRQDGGFIGVYDDVYPGVSSSGLPDSENGNLWSHRVFTPRGSVSARETVSTLTLEALAYLPPAIVNEVRVFSRMTRTAKWHNLSYDLGRYAYCAVDVSDCFDINKVYAGERRSSAAGERVNLSSLYPDNGSSLDNLFDRANDVPYVSLADFNVAAGRSEFTPFMRYVGSTGAKIYTQDDYRAVSNALFVTDTWYPATNAYLDADLTLRTRTSGTSVYDLDAGAQPFRTFDAKSFAYLVNQTGMDQNGPFAVNLGGVGMACLYDYLDRDSIPLSLALPTFETAPMVCGVSLLQTAALNPRFETSQAVAPFQYQRVVGANTYTIERTITKYAFKGMANPLTARLVGTVLYPFKRLQATGRAAGRSYKIIPLVAMYYGSSDMTARPDNADAFRTELNLWTSPGCRKGVAWYAGDPQQLNLPAEDLCGTDDEQNQKKAVVRFNLQLKDPASAVDMAVCYKVDEVDKTPPPPPGTQPPPPPPLVTDKLTLDNLQNGSAEYFCPFQDNGTAENIFDNNYNNVLYGATDLQNGKEQNWNLPSGTWRLHYAVWLRVVDSGDKTVDLVPAVFADDVSYLDGNNMGRIADNAQFTALSGDRAPLLPFRANDVTAFKYDKETLEKLDGTALTEFDNWKTLYAIDPRYNFAPEDWKGVDANFNDEGSWLQNTTGYRGASGRDRDLFMFTSDQEYLQSVGELQFLPWVKDLGLGQPFALPDQEFKNLSRYNGVVGSLANERYYWRSYTAIDDDDEGRNPYFDMIKDGQHAEIISGTGDFRLNPFSPDSRILGAAIVDTPYDYYIASTNGNCNPKASMDLSSAQSLSFGPRGTCDRWDEIDCNNIASRLRQEFLFEANNGRSDITDALAGLSWQDSNRKRIFNLEEDLERPLNDVDRKFLFSFWRECFQNRQQLFLVFIRAEPLTVGGSTGDAIANAQLGARGVALVWRDPAPPNGVRRPRSTGRVSDEEERKRLLRPHRTRVLFYHQFD